jgi:hypothetical protein
MLNCIMTIHTNEHGEFFSYMNFAYFRIECPTVQQNPWIVWNLEIISIVIIWALISHNNQAISVNVHWDAITNFDGRNTFIRNNSIY